MLRFNSYLISGLPVQRFGGYVIYSLLNLASMNLLSTWFSLLDETLTYFLVTRMDRQKLNLPAPSETIWWSFLPGSKSEAQRLGVNLIILCSIRILLLTQDFFLFG